MHDLTPSTLLAVFAGTVAAAGLGVALVVYAVLGLMKVTMHVPPRAERWAGPLTGAATGLVTGPTGVFVVPAVPYLNGLGLPRDDLIQALGLSFTVSTVALAAGLLWHGAVDAPAVGAYVIAIAPALAGMWLGGWVRKRVEQEAFRRWFFVGLAVLGVEIAWRAIAVQLDFNALQH